MISILMNKTEHLAIVAIATMAVLLVTATVVDINDVVAKKKNRHHGNGGAA